MICVPTSLQSMSVASPEGWRISGCLVLRDAPSAPAWQLVKVTLGNQRGSEKLMRQVETKRAEQKRWESPHIIADWTLRIDDVKERQGWISPLTVWEVVVMKGRRGMVINLNATSIQTKSLKIRRKLISAVVSTLQFCSKTQQTGRQRPNQYTLKAEN